MKVTKTITANSRQQLIDLNGDSVNFEVTFSAKSKDGSPFKILVVDQNMLDNEKGELKYRIADKGTMEGNIKADKNNYQSYFLCIQSEKPTQIDIEIDKTELPETFPNPEQKQLPNNQINTQVNNQVNNQAPEQKTFPTEKEESFFSKWKIPIIIVVLAVGGYFVYKMMNKKDEENTTVKSENIVTGKPLRKPALLDLKKSNSVDNSDAVSNAGSSVSKHSSGSTATANTTATSGTANSSSSSSSSNSSGNDLRNSSLLKRLNSLPIG